MSAPPTQEQADAIKAITDNIEVTWQTLQRSKRALSVLVNAGRATCTDVLTYNQQVEFTYTYQKTMAGLVEHNGGSAPAIPLPLYVAWKGKTGDAALRVDCASAQLNGATPTGTGDYYVGADKVRWATAETQASKDAIEAVLNRARAQKAQQQPGQLGFPFLAVALIIILASVFIKLFASTITSWVDALTGIAARREQTKQVAITAERHASTLEARAKCYDACLAKEKDATICARDCSRLNPIYTPPAWASGLFDGIFGKVLIVAAAAGVGFAGYKLYKHYGHGDHDTAEAGTSGFFGNDHDPVEYDDVDYDNAIDV